MGGKIAISGSQNRQRLPQCLLFSLTIQKTLGQTLDRAVFDLSKTEKAPGLTVVANSRVQCFEDCLIQLVTLQRLLSISRGMQFHEKLLEELWHVGGNGEDSPSRMN